MPRGRRGGPAGDLRDCAKGPETGYGYIEAAEALGSEALVPIARFVEKPDRATAESFVASGLFTWNSGMFLFRASAILAELERLADGANGPGYLLPLEAGWSDVGSWSALWETADHEAHGNVLRGKVSSEGARNCYLRNEHRLAVGAREGNAHRRIYRPWGSYDGVVDGERWQVKKIVVSPGACLSLQMHHHRAEHLEVVQGTAVVEKDGVAELVGENQSTYIPLGATHRLTNPGKIPVEMIEVRSGPYLGENDIVRFEDRFGRTEISPSQNGVTRNDETLASWVKPH